MLQFVAVGLALLQSVSAVAIARAAVPNCREVTIPVSVTALNKLLPVTLNLLSLPIDTNLLELVQSFPDNEVSGTYNIAGRYCEPTASVPGRANTLQILVHGISLDRNYWSGLNAPGSDDKYSYVTRAAAAGYPTLAIDRICNGASSRPFATVVCQVPMDAAVQHGVIQAARAGKIANKTFSKIIYVAHSYGSLTTNALLRAHPDDVDATVVTAFTPYLLGGAAGFLTGGVFLPAAVVDPVKYSSLLLDPGYLVGTNRQTLKGIFFYKDGFEPAVEDESWTERGTVPLGEFATAPLGQIPALGYTKPLFVANGQHDQIFCSPLQTDPLVGNRGECGQGAASASNAVKILFPNATPFGFNQYAKASHFLNLHNTAPNASADILAWLAGQGF